MRFQSRARTSPGRMKAKTMRVTMDLVGSGRVSSMARICDIVRMTGGFRLFLRGNSIPTSGFRSSISQATA